MNDSIPIVGRRSTFADVSTLEASHLGGDGRVNARESMPNAMAFKGRGQRRQRTMSGAPDITKKSSPACKIR